MERSLRSASQDMALDVAMALNVPTWNEFSQRIKGGHTNNIEAVHDKIHLIVGGGGHMGEVEYAGFDPIFQLHHAQLDRVADKWQAKHKQWVPDPDSEKKLEPFWREGGTEQEPYWNSKGIQQTSTFNYSYLPDLTPLANATDAILGELCPVPLAKGTTSFTNWTIRVRMKKFEVGGSFVVFLFFR